MKLNFDIRGNLTPYERIALSYKEFVEFFVESFEKDSARYEIFEHYKRYTEEFQAKVTTDFKQWIDGSFVTNNKNPKDIDLINLVDYEIVEEKGTLS